MTKIEQARRSIETAMARIGCPPGDNADADMYRDLQRSLAILKDMEGQEPVLRFGMRLQDMEGPPMITVDEAMAIAWPWIMQTHGGIAPPTGAEADLRARLTAAATNNTNDNG